METDSQNKLTNIRLTRREAAAQRHRVTLSSFSRTVHRFILFSFILSVVWFKSAWHLISTWRLSGRRESYQTWRSVQIRPSTAEICYLKELFMVGSFIKHDPDTTEQQESNISPVQKARHHTENPKGIKPTLISVNKSGSETVSQTSY